MCLFLSAGILLLVATQSRFRIVAALVFLSLGVWSREIAFVLVPGAIGVHIFAHGNRRVAFVLPGLCILLWLLLQTRVPWQIGGATGDLPLFARGAVVTTMANLATFVRSTGLLLLISLLAVVWPFRLLFFLPFCLLSLIAWQVLLLMPILVMITACLETKKAMLGSVWAALSIMAVMFYGHFTSRYTVELLLGFAFCVAPALACVPQKRLLLLIPLILFHVATGFWPDAVHHYEATRGLAFALDRRFQVLEHVTQVRAHDWLTFTGRARQEWIPVREAAALLGETDSLGEPVWRSGEYWRISRPFLLSSYHRASLHDIVFSKHGIWEWRESWGAVIPAKGSTIKVRLGAEQWSVRVSEKPPRDDVPITITDGEVAAWPPPRPRAINNWLSHIPELNDRQAAAAWLREVWNQEVSRRNSANQLSADSFVELELGKLFLRDDGWLDEGELAWLRSHTRRQTPVHRRFK
jgi:hypothetical protein